MESDKQIQEEVKAYSSFRKHFSVYAVVVVLLWVAWWIQPGKGMYPWALYPMVIWAGVLIIHYIIAYRSFRKRNSSTV